MAGSAVNACAWSAYVDYLFEGKIVNLTQTFVAHWPSVHRPMSPQPDLLAAAILIVVIIVIACGANCTSKINAIIVCVNIAVLVFTSIVGFIYADLDNWRLKDKGGFLPHGFVGVLSGSTACFWAMSGYEASAISIEEAKTPQKSIPRATFIAIALVTILYLLTSSAITLVTPYDAIDTLAPLPSAFSSRGIIWAKYIVLFGPLLGLTTTLLNSMFGFVRIVYAMSKDGLLWPRFSHVHSFSHIPLWSLFLGSLIIIPVACLMDLKDIISFGVVLALLQYSLVSVIVIILRYKPLQNNTHHGFHGVMMEDVSADDNFDEDTAELVQNGNSYNVPMVPKLMKQANLRSSYIWLADILCCEVSSVIPVILFFLLLIICIVVVLCYLMFSMILSSSLIYILLIALLCATALLLLMIIAAHKQNVENLIIKVTLIS